MRNRKMQQVVCVWILAMLCLAIGVGTAFAQEEPPATETEVIPTAETELPPSTETPEPISSDTETPEPTVTETPTETEEPILFDTETPTPMETEIPTETEEPVFSDTETSEPTRTGTSIPTETFTSTPLVTVTATVAPLQVAPILKPFIRLNSTQIKLQWEQVPGATGYRIYVTQAPDLEYPHVDEYDVFSSEFILDVKSLEPVYYQVAASIGDDYGPKSVVGIATAAILIQPQIRSVSADSANTLKLAWKEVPGVTGYRIWRSEVGPSMGYNWTKNIGKVTELTVSVPSNRTYYFRIAGLLGDQIGPLSASAAGSTNAVVLAQPTIQSITRVSDLKVKLSWTAIPGATGYKIWRANWKNPTDFSWFTTVANVSQVELPVPRIGFYNFKIAAMLQETEGPQSDVAAVTTAILNKTYIWLVDNRNPNVLCVYWNRIPNATGYRLWRSETSPISGYTWVNTIYDDTYTKCVPVTLQEPYYFKVAPMSGTIEGPQSAPVAGSLDGIDLTAPTLNAPVRISETKVSLSWTPVFGAVGYDIHQANSTSPNNYYWINSVFSETSFIADVYPDKTVHFKVRAMKDLNEGHGPFSNTVTINMATTPIVTSKMNAPTAISNTVLRLSWSAVPGATGYRIWRSTTSANAGFAPLGVTDANTLATTTSVQPNRTYYYKVQAMIGTTDGPLSAAVSGKTTGTALGRPTIQAVTPVSQNAFKVTWSAVPGVSEYRVWRSESANSGYTATWLIKNQTSMVTTVPTTKTYYYKVAAVSGSTIGPLSAPVSGSTVAPTLNPIGNVSGGKFVIRWTAVPGAKSYRLYRSETASTHGYTWAVNMGSLTAAVTNVPDLNKRYYYKVVAVYPDGRLSSFSNVESKIYHSN